MSNISDEKLNLIYPQFLKKPEYYKNRINDVMFGFKHTFSDNTNEVRVFSAPGRTEIGGNHTDHQRGNVLAAAVDIDILAGAAINGTDTIRLFSEGYKMTEVCINVLKPIDSEVNTSSALIRGVAARITELGYSVNGFDVYMISDVLKGSGLSSSAAFEVIIGVIINGLFCSGEINSVMIAKIGQYAENRFFGKPSGLMDQMASSVGGIVAIDFSNINEPNVRKIDFDFATTGYSLCIIDSGADHADLTNEYSYIPSEMKSVAKACGKEVLSEVSINEIMSNISEVRRAAGDRGVLRAIHFFKDNQRAIKESQMLECGNMQAFLKLVKESGYSSWMYLQNVTVNGSNIHQEVAYALAMCDIILDGKGAFRVHGGGFAGTIQAFVPNDIIEEFKFKIEKYVGEGCCHILSIRNEGGVELT